MRLAALALMFACAHQAPIDFIRTGHPQPQ
jgi:hypothetical protein